MAQNQQLGTFGQVVSVNTASNTVTITSQIAVGNVSINSTGVSISGGSINNTNYPGTANNANNLGGVAAASYVNTAGSYTITGVHTYSANIVIGAAGISANGGFGSAGQSLLSNGSSVYWATAGATLNANNSDGTTYYIGLSSATTGSWTNAVVSTTGLSFVPSTGTLNVGNTVVATNFNGSAATVGGNTASTLRSYSDTMAGTAYTNAAAYTDTKIGTANTAITGNAATAYTNAAAYTDTKIGTANAAITGNAATAYTNAVSYVDGLKLDSVTNTSVSYIPVANTVKNAYDRAIDANTRAASAQTAAAAAYTNAVSYTDTKIETANAAITGNAATAYTNAVSYTDGKILTANAAITGNAATAYTNATTFAANASNISSGTLAEARLPYRMDQNVRTTDNITVGNMTVSGNLYVGSNVNIIGANNLSIIDNMIYLNANNTTANPDLGFAGNYNDGTYRHAGFFRDASDGIWKVFDSYLPEPDANVYIDTTNTSFKVANFQANTFYGGNTSTNWFIANTSGVFVNSTLIGNATGAYGKTEGNLNVNSAVFSTNAVNANNATYLGGQLGSYYAANSLLANYQTTAGLSTAVAALTSNNATYAFGKTEGNLNVNNATTAYSKTEGNLNVNNALTSNNSSYLGGTAAASYLTSATAASTYAPLASPTFTGTVSVAQANVLNQTLTDATTIAWNTASGQVATVTLGASRTMGAPSNLKVGTYILHVIQGGSGSYGITWNSVFKWPAGVAPVLSTAVGARDVFSFISDGTNLYGSYLTDVK